jgi:hypothetical protein
MSDVGIPVLCNVELENAFVFDVGKAMDVFTSELDSPHQPWMAHIPENLRAVYERRRCDLIGYN